MFMQPFFSLYMYTHSSSYKSQYSEGDFIIRNGGPGDTLFIVSHGQVRLIDLSVSGVSI